MTTYFDRAITLEPGLPGSFVGGIDRDWWGHRAPWGGAVVAMMLQAMTGVVDDADRAVRSLTTYFLDPPADEPMHVSVTVERRGGAMTAVTARMTQSDRTPVVSIATFSRGRDSFEFDDARMPDVPSPDASLRVPQAEGFPRFLQHFDMRAAFGALPYAGVERAEGGGWIRLEEGRVLDAPLAAAFTDVWIPSVLPRATFPVVAPTIDLTIHFRHALPLDGARPDDFAFVRFSSTDARDGIWVEDGEVWSADGRLVARSRQQALVLPLR